MLRYKKMNPYYLIAIKVEMPSQIVRQVKMKKNYDSIMLCLRFQFSKILVKYIEEYIHFLFKWQFSCIVHGRVLARHALQIKFLG